MNLNVMNLVELDHHEAFAISAGADSAWGLLGEVCGYIAKAAVAVGEKIVETTSQLPATPQMMG